MMTPRSPRFPILLALAALLGLAPAASAGDGRFSGGPDLPVTQASQVAAADFNSDGRPDLAAVSPADKLVIMFAQTPTGELNPMPSVDAGTKPEMIAVGDFNRDGDTDFAVGDTADRDIKVFSGRIGPGFFREPDIDLNRTPLALATTDFNTDGVADLTVSTQPATGPNTIVNLQSKGNGTFEAKGGLEGPIGFAVADFDSDTIEDVAFGAQPGYAKGNLATGSGTGSFGGRSDIALPQPARHRRGWAVGDFNSDAKPDVVASLSSDLTAVRLGGGNGKFAGGSDVLTRGAPSAVAVGDFNSDGNEDFVVTDTSAGARVHVRLGNGKGGFSAAPEVPGAGKPVDVAIADFNYDGNDDLAIADPASNSVKVRYGTGRPALDGNLLVNGGFEGPTYTGKVQGPFTLTGWELDGSVGGVPYGRVSHAFAPARIASPRYGTGGGRMLAGGFSQPTGGVTGVTQTVDVSEDAGAIDGGRATANLSAYLGGALGFEDTMTGRAEFLSRTGASLGSFQIGPVTAADRNKQTTLLRRAASRPVPAGTRRIRVRMISNDADKTVSSALADNAKLTVTTRPAPAAPATPGTPGTPPGEAPGAQTFGRDTLVSLRLVRRRVKAGQPLKVRVRNRNAFAVSGRIQGARRTRLAVGAQATRTVKVRLSRKQRRRLLSRRVLSPRLIAVINDPAGQTRRVSRRVRVRLRSK